MEASKNLVSLQTFVHSKALAYVYMHAWPFICVWWVVESFVLSTDTLTDTRFHLNF